MHISDGILSSQLFIATSVVGLALVAYSLKNLKNETISLVAAMSAVFFISSFIHIPLGPVQIHLIMIGLIGILLGKMVFLAVFVALLLQALLLGYGGLSSLGANLLIMGLPAFITFLFIRSGVLNLFNEKLKYFCIGFFPALIATLIMALLLILAKEEYLYASYTIILANIPIMVIEGLVTIFLIHYLKKAIPSLLKEAKL